MPGHQLPQHLQILQFAKGLLQVDQCGDLLLRADAAPGSCISSNPYRKIFNLRRNRCSTSGVRLDLSSRARSRARRFSRATEPAAAMGKSRDKGRSRHLMRERREVKLRHLGREEPFRSHRRRDALPLGV